MLRSGNDLSPQFSVLRLPFALLHGLPPWEEKVELWREVRCGLDACLGEIFRPRTSLTERDSLPRRVGRIVRAGESSEAIHCCFLQEEPLVLGKIRAEMKFFIPENLVVLIFPFEKINEKKQKIGKGKEKLLNRRRYKQSSIFKLWVK